MTWRVGRKTFIPTSSLAACARWWFGDLHFGLGHETLNTVWFCIRSNIHSPTIRLVVFFECFPLTAVLQISTASCGTLNSSYTSEPWVVHWSVWASTTLHVVISSKPGIAASVETALTAHTSYSDWVKVSNDVGVTFWLIDIIGLGYPLAQHVVSIGSSASTVYEVVVKLVTRGDTVEPEINNRSRIPRHFLH